jgi:DNA polymerase-3 subunit epsilon
MGGGGKQIVGDLREGADHGRPWDKMQEDAVFYASEIAALVCPETRAAAVEYVIRTHSGGGREGGVREGGCSYRGPGFVVRGRPDEIRGGRVYEYRRRRGGAAPPHPDNEVLQLLCYLHALGVDDGTLVCTRPTGEPEALDVRRPDYAEEWEAVVRDLTTAAAEVAARVPKGARRDTRGGGQVPWSPALGRVLGRGAPARAGGGGGGAAAGPRAGGGGGGAAAGPAPGPGPPAPFELTTGSCSPGSLAGFGFRGRLAFLDTETTGLDPAADRVIEVAVVVRDYGTRAETRYTVLLDPEGRKSNPGALEAHQIPDGLLVGRPKFAEIAEELRALLGDQIVAHSAEFDRSMLNGEFERAGYPPIGSDRFICSRDLARGLRLKGGACALNTLALKYGVARIGEAHRALSDTLLLADLYPLLEQGVRGPGQKEEKGAWACSGRNKGDGAPCRRAVRARGAYCHWHQDQAPGGERQVLYAYALGECPVAVGLMPADADGAEAVLRAIEEGPADRAERYAYVPEIGLDDYLLEAAREAAAEDAEDAEVVDGYMELLRASSDPPWHTGPLEYTLGAGVPWPQALVSGPAEHYLFLWGREGGRLALVGQGTRAHVQSLHDRWNPEVLMDRRGDPGWLEIDTARHGFELDAEEVAFLEES